MSVTVFLDFRPAPGRAEELLELLQQGRDVSLAVAGCEAYEVHQGSDDPHRFMMVERWASPEAHREHFDKNVVASGVLDQVMSIMLERPGRRPITSRVDWSRR
jgi:quinol monooxygenase YgiN